MTEGAAAVTVPAQADVQRLRAIGVRRSIDIVPVPVDGKRLLLWSTLALGVGVLGWMAWRLSHQLDVSAERGPPENVAEPEK